MLYIPKIDDYLEILTDEEVKDFENYASEDWIALDVIIKHSIKIFQC